MEEPLNIEVNLTFDEYKKYAWNRYWGLKKNSRIAIISFWTICIGLATYIFIDSLFNVSFTFTSILCFLFFFIILPVNILSSGKQFKYRYSQWWSAKTKYTFAENKIQVDGKPEITAEFDYGRLWRVFETADAFYMDFRKTDMFAIPKDAMDTETTDKVGMVLREKARKFFKCYK